MSHAHLHTARPILVRDIPIQPVLLSRAAQPVLLSRAATPTCISQAVYILSLMVGTSRQAFLHLRSEVSCVLLQCRLHMRFDCGNLSPSSDCHWLVFPYRFTAKLLQKFCFGGARHSIWCEALASCTVPNAPRRNVCYHL